MTSSETPKTGFLARRPKSYQLSNTSVHLSLLVQLGRLKIHTVKQKGHSKIDKTKILMTNGSLMKVKSIAECSLGPFCNTFDLH